MGFDPIYTDPVYDDTTEPRFIYEKFVPKPAPALDGEDFAYEEKIDENDPRYFKREVPTSRIRKIEKWTGSTRNGSGELESARRITIDWVFINRKKV